MAQTLTLNGKDYPFAFTYTCLRKLSKEKDLDEIEQSERAFVLAINKGYEREGEKTTMTSKELIDILDNDDEALGVLSSALKRDMGKLAPSEDEGK